MDIKIRFQPKKHYYQLLKYMVSLYKDFKTLYLDKNLNKIKIGEKWILTSKINIENKRHTITKNTKEYKNIFWIYKKCSHRKLKSVYSL